jgi:hypothetical protein
MKARLPTSWVLGLVLVTLAKDLQGQVATNLQPATSNTPTNVLSRSYESPWLTEFAKLAKADLDDRVMLAFIDGAGTFNLTPDQIISLRDFGVSAEVISTILQHDSEVALGLRQVTAALPASRPLFQDPTRLQSDHSKPEPGNPQAADRSIAEASVPSSDSGVADPMNSELPTAALALATEQEVDSPEAAMPVTPEQAGFSPVRKPYAEEITAPFFVVKAPGRVSNLVVIQMLH